MNLVFQVLLGHHKLEYLFKLSEDVEFEAHGFEILRLGVSKKSLKHAKVAPNQNGLISQY